MFKGLEPNGILIAFEGTDGCGKTTTLNIIKKALAKTSIPTVYTKEPAGTPLGEKVREKLIDPSHNYSKPEQAQLFIEARRDHLRKVILPALNAHKLIICDRYVLSSLAYQGDYVPNPYYIKKEKRGSVLKKYSESTRSLARANRCDLPYMDKNYILERNQAIPEFVVPNLNVYLQASPKTDVQRLNKRAEKSDKFDKALEDLKNMRYLQGQYRHAIEDLDTPHLLVNADRSPKERASYILDSIMELVHDEPTPDIYPFTPIE